jgi:hypothetical protein
MRRWPSALLLGEEHQVPLGRALNVSTFGLDAVGEREFVPSI